MIEALGRNVQTVQLEIRPLQPVEQREPRRVGLRARVEDEIVRQGRLARLRKEVQDLAQDFVRGRPVVLEEAIWRVLIRGEGGRWVVPDGLTLQAVVKRHLAHDLLVFDAEE